MKGQCECMAHEVSAVGNGCVPSEAGTAESFQCGAGTVNTVSPLVLDRSFHWAACERGRGGRPGAESGPTSLTDGHRRQDVVGGLTPLSVTLL